MEMENTEPNPMDCAEDVCEICGAHVGYGVRLFHLGRCDEHSNDEDGTQMEASARSI
jgi:hypothetical protein